MEKSEVYEDLIVRLGSLLEWESDYISVLSTISCEVYHAFEAFHWVGFYRVVGEGVLKVGPYQGGHGCLEIAFERGVCGKCVREEAVQIVDDVDALPYHIACSSETKSEIVLPVYNKEKQFIAVFDIDSIEYKTFDDVDEQYLNKILGFIKVL